MAELTIGALFAGAVDPDPDGRPRDPLDRRHGPARGIVRERRQVRNRAVRRCHPNPLRRHIGQRQDSRPHRRGGGCRHGAIRTGKAGQYRKQGQKQFQMVILSLVPHIRRVARFV